MKKIVSILILLALGVAPAAAQNNDKKVWEFGLGGTVWQFNRTSFSHFSTLPDGGYVFDLDLKNTVWGGNVSVARQLNDHFYLDLQGSVGHAGKVYGNDDDGWLAHAGLGLQWRLGDYFGSRYIDPYLRVGAGYMYKGFTTYYVGSEGASPDNMEWIHQNIHNKDGADRTHLIPLAAGAGINMWLNDRWGVGFQGDYLLMPYENVANSLQGTVRLMVRIGGKSKRPAPETVIQYVDRPVERIVEVEKVVERVVEKEVPGNATVLMSLFNNIDFDFDSANLTAESQTVLDRIAAIMKENASDRFLITGFTDVRGSEPYNEELSGRRARAVVDALTGRGVSAAMMKCRGAGERIAIAATDASDEVRRGDRKVTIEIVANPAYWDYLEETLK